MITILLLLVSDSITALSSGGTKGLPKEADASYFSMTDIRIQKS